MRRLVIVLFIGILFIGGCSSNPFIDVYEPEWYTPTITSSDFDVYGYGLARSVDQAMSAESAEQTARYQMARNEEVYLADLFKQYSSSTTPPEQKEVFEQFRLSVSKSLVEINQKNVAARNQETKYDTKKKEYISWAQVGLIKKIVIEAAKNEAAMRTQYNAIQANQILDEELKRLREYKGN